jgi:hypothetical protein
MDLDIGLLLSKLPHYESSEFGNRLWIDILLGATGDVVSDKDDRFLKA